MPDAQPAAPPPVVLRDVMSRSPLQVLTRNRRLVLELTRRDIAVRYRGSRLSLLWPVLQPLLLLALYTFVFGTIFRMKWGGPVANGPHFATILFVGLIAHTFLAECLNRAPGLVLAHAAYVKKVVFPLAVLPWMAVLSALFHAGMNMVVLLAFVLFGTGGIPWTALLLPLVWLPLLLVTLGLTWGLAALGVYLRDIGQTIGLVTTLLLFLSPVFYPVDAVPAAFRWIVELNFLTPVIVELREILLLGTVPDPMQWLLLLAIGWLTAIVGLYGFERARPGFADVV
jgi:lipopolysaccharide transport system permease protein